MPKKNALEPGMVIYKGKLMEIDDALIRLHYLPNEVTLTSSEAALFLRQSITTLERMRGTANGPRYIQGGSYGAKGTNQSCTYHKHDLIDWQTGNKVSNSMAAAVKKGQMFATIFDLAEHEAFYLDADGNVAGMVERTSLATVIERLGEWDILWMAPVEAASRRWSNLADHQSFAAEIQQVLSRSAHGIEAGVEATDIAESMRDESGNDKVVTDNSTLPKGAKDPL